jgi:RimJ/RimL family protein N-acetyltransferase
VIIERATGELVGRSGLQWMDDADETELAWTLRRDMWGRGYATEAARGVAEWAFDALGLELVTSRIEHGNERSQSVARRLGMTVIRTQMWNEWHFDVYAVTRERYFEFMPATLDQC